MLQRLFGGVWVSVVGGGWGGRGGAVLGGTIERSASFCVSAASPAPSIPLPLPGGAGGEERVGDAQQLVQPSPGGSGAVSLNAQRSRGQRAANAFPWHRGRRGCGAAGFAGFQSLAAEQGRASWWPRRLGSTPATPPALPGACDASRGQAAAKPSARRPASPASLPSPAHQLLPREPNFCCGLGLAEPEWLKALSWVAGAAPPRGDDLAAVALGLVHLGGCRLASRQRHTAPARHVSKWILRAPGLLGRAGGPP